MAVGGLMWDLHTPLVVSSTELVVGSDMDAPVEQAALTAHHIAGTDLGIPHKVLAEVEGSHDIHYKVPAEGEASQDNLHIVAGHDTDPDNLHNVDLGAAAVLLDVYQRERAEDRSRSLAAEVEGDLRFYP
jgi:hypothetical protein